MQQTDMVDQKQRDNTPNNITYTPADILFKVSMGDVRLAQDFFDMCLPATINPNSGHFYPLH